MTHITDIYKNKKSSGLNKFERICLVRNLGLNAPDSRLLRSQEEWQNNEDWLKQLSHYTVRTMREGGSGVDPYFPIIEAQEFEPYRVQFFQEERNIIISPGIDPKDIIMSGTVLRDGDVTEVDVVIGAYAVPRMVTHDGRIDKHVVFHEGEPSGDQYIDEIHVKLQEVESKHPPLKETTVIYEFSYYRPQVGHLSENIIFWEITGYNRMDDLGVYLENIVRDNSV